MKVRGEQSAGWIAEAWKWPLRKPIVLGEHEVDWKTSIKYLWVQLDRRLSFGEHLKIAAAIAIQCGAILARLMPNIGGPREAKRRFSAQRLVGLRIVSAYKTVSTSAVLVLASVPPIDSSTQSSSARNGMWQGSPSVRQWVPGFLLTRWSLSCSSLSGSGRSSSCSSHFWWRRESLMGVESDTTRRASRNRIGACTRGPASWADLAVHVDRVRNLFVPPLVGAAIWPA